MLKEAEKEHGNQNVYQLQMVKVLGELDQACKHLGNATEANLYFKEADTIDEKREKNHLTQSKFSLL